MIHLDTNICIYIINERSKAALQALRARGGSDVALSAIALAELEHGVAKSAAAERNRVALRHFLAPFEIVPFDDTAAQHYGDIRAGLEQRGTPIGAIDLFIAAHARSAGATLVTNNVREFKRVPDLAVENWTR